MHLIQDIQIIERGENERQNKHSLKCSLELGKNARTWWQKRLTWWAKAPHLVGKAPHSVGKAPHLVGKAPHLVGKAPHLVGKKRLLKSTRFNCVY